IRISMPRRRYPISTICDGRIVHLFHARKPGLERLPTPHLLINFIARIDSAQRRVGKRPLAGIETISLVNERGVVLSLTRFLPEDCLPSIGVAGPFVYAQHAGKITDVPYAVEHRLRQIIKNLSLE